MSYILRVGGMGYFRKGAAAPHIAAGELELIEGAPEFTYPIYAVHPDSAAERPDIMASLKGLTEVME